MYLLLPDGKGRYYEPEGNHVTSRTRANLPVRGYGLIQQEVEPLVGSLNVLPRF